MTNTKDAPINAERDDDVIELTDADKERLTPDEIAELTASNEDDAASSDDPAPAEETPDPAAAADETPPDPAPEPEPLPELKDVTDIDAQITANKDSMAQLLSEYEDGQLSEADLQSRQDEILAARDNLVMQKTQADLHNDSVTAQRAQREQEEQDRREAADKAFIDDVKAYEAKYPEVFMDKHVDGFDAQFKAIDQNPVYAHLTVADKLERAHANYAAIAQNDGNPLKASLPGSGGVGGQQQQGADSIDDIPTNSVGADTGKFAQLAAAIDATDDVDEIEKLMSQLPPDQAEAFASWQDG